MVITFDLLCSVCRSISWIMYSFAGHPEIQAKAQKEIDDLFDGRPDDTMDWLVKFQLEFCMIKDSS